MLSTNFEDYQSLECPSHRMKGFRGPIILLGEGKWDLRGNEDEGKKRKRRKAIFGLIPM